MAMTHTFDLQRFADSNVQTTGTQSLSAEMKTYYGMELLENAKPAAGAQPVRRHQASACGRRQDRGVAQVRLL